MGDLKTTQATDAAANRHETVFCVFMGAVAYLWRDNPAIVDTPLLATLASLLGLNLLAGAALRRRPGDRTLAAGFIAANAAVITTLIALSGGEASNLWILYLLPVFSACLYLGRAGVVATVAAVIGLHAALHFSDGSWDETDAFELLVQGGLFVFAAAVAHRFAARERCVRARLEGARASLSRLVEGRISRDSTFSHDINSSIAAVLGFAAVSLEEDGLPVDVRSDLQNIQKAALRAREMVVAFRERERVEESHEAENIGCR